MTVTLHWWMAPLAVFGFGVLWAMYLDRNSYGYLGGLEAGLVYVGTLIATIFLVIGHFI